MVSIAQLKRLAGSQIRVRMIRGTDNVVISGGGRKPVVKQITGNVGVSAVNIIKARRRLLRKKRR